jgi:hypothetical protein
MFVGLCMAIVTLMGEVIYHRRKMMPPGSRSKKKPGLFSRKPSIKIVEPEKKEPVSILKKDPSEKSLKKKKSVTLGDKDGFESKTGLPKVSYITVYPRQ